MEHLDGLTDIVGRERSVRGVCQALHHVVVGMNAPYVGAMHVTCADETEVECVTAFQSCFVPYVLPMLKTAHAAPFRLANLGGRYEWGAVHIAEDHFAVEIDDRKWELLVVKVNAHCAVAGEGEEATFGTLTRYGRESTCCGALAATLGGDVHPFTQPLRSALSSEGLDRIATLTDPTRVPPSQRALFAALSSARLQARAVMLDVQDHRPVVPMLHLIVPCVTLNRPGPDTEVVVGVYVADRRTEDVRELYLGLGDDPGGYELTWERDRLLVTDEEVGKIRPARDHRAIVRSTWHAKARERTASLKDERLRRIEQDVAEMKHHHHPHARWLLRSLLLVLAELAPGPAAVLLFANGAAGIHHAFRVRHLAGELEDSHDAQVVLREVHDRVDTLEAAEAQALLELLLAEYRS